MPRCPLATLALAAALGLARAAAAQEEDWLSRFELHGFGELQLRSYAEDYDPDDWLLSQWANVLNLELEADLAPDGFGPFDLISGFARLEVRYDCIYRGCGVVPSYRYFGNRAKSAPRNLTDARRTPFSGEVVVRESTRVHSGNELLDITEIPPFDRLIALGSPESIRATVGPLLRDRFAVKATDGSIGPTAFPLGPWRFDTRIDPNGSLETIENSTFPLPLRPAVPAPGEGGLDPHGLFVPSQALLARYDDFDDFEHHFSEGDLAWNHGQGQDERELKEAYLDLELLDGRLWIRGGKQTIVWGKTELFRTTDQFNPQDLALSSLPGLEESRLAQWSLRGVYSFYDVGPAEDVRLELAVNIDDFEPLDLGRCGEPYTVWLVCAKTFGLFAHGFAGAGLAGEMRPPDPFDGWRALEVGARVEFRLGRFSFQISDFYGYEDAPVIDSFNEYERTVDPLTGRPLDVNGDPLLPTQSAEEVLALHPGNRDAFDFACGVTKGLGRGTAFEEILSERCLVDLPNASEPPLPPEFLSLRITEALGVALGGSPSGEFVVRSLAQRPVTEPVDLIELNVDPADGPGGGFFAGSGAIGRYLTEEQEALLGCGAFYGTDCDIDGIDLFNAEASVLLQAFPEFPLGAPVATRPVDGLPAPLPGARGPDGDIDGDGIADVMDPDVPAELLYDPLVDGCVAPGPTGCNAGDPGRSAAANSLVYPISTVPGDPRSGQPLPNELAGVSFNFMSLLAALGEASRDANGVRTDPDCSVDEPIKCLFVTGVFDVAGSRRPEVKAGGNGLYGRRDFVWHGGAELAIDYKTRNVLGIAFDFAEDRTKTNWSVEATWYENQAFAVQNRLRGFARNDTFNMTVSVDRPTFINFLNPGRTFFMNSQWFVRWIDDYEQGQYVIHGPISFLGTLTVATGYHQDRLLPAVTWVHDVRSSSGGLVAQFTYRFTNEFSATFGTASFYGKPESLPLPLRQPILTNAGGTYTSRSRYDGLVPIAERDEVYMQVRYTF